MKRAIRVIAILVATIVAVPVVWFVVALFIWSNPAPHKPPPLSSFDPKQFQRLAGFSVPTGAHVLRYDKNFNGGMTGDWSYSATFSVTQSDISVLLKQQPWKGVDWHTPPLSDAASEAIGGRVQRSQSIIDLRHIGLHCMVELTGPKSMPDESGRAVAVSEKFKKLWFVAWRY